MGPTAAVLVSMTREAAGESVARMLVQTASEVQGADFWIVDTSPIGGHYRGEARPFSYSIKLATEEYEMVELEQMEECFGLRAQAVIELAAGCNAAEDHCVLAELSLALIVGQSGIVDFGGELSVPDGVSAGCLEQLPTGEHVADERFLNGWLANEGFHMVK